MPSLKCALHENGPKVITLSWKLFYKEVTVAFHDQTVATLTDREALKAGVPVQLPNGAQILVRLQGAKLLVTQDGAPLPGSPGSARAKTKEGRVVLFVIAGFTFLAGIVSLLVGGGGDLGGPDAFIGYLAAGSAFLGLAFWAAYTLSVIPYIIAVVLVALDTVLLAVLYQGGAFQAYFFRALFLFFLIRAIPAALAQKRMRNQGGV